MTTLSQVTFRLTELTNQLYANRIEILPGESGSDEDRVIEYTMRFRLKPDNESELSMNFEAGRSLNLPMDVRLTCLPSGTRQHVEIRNTTAPSEIVFQWAKRELSPEEFLARSFELLFRGNRPRQRIETG